MPFAPTPDTVAGARYTFAVATCNDLPPCALTPREQREFDGLSHAARRRDWLAGRYAAKRAIGARWDLPADRIELMSRLGAAPRPCIRTRTGRWAPLSDRLTVAHRDGLAIAAAFPSTAWIGVDLERAAEVSPLELRYMASESERSRLQGIDPTLVWILKEAAWKALGLASTAPLSSLQLVFRAGTDVLVAVRHGLRNLSAQAKVRRLQTDQPLIAALVAIAPGVS